MARPTPARNAFRPRCEALDSRLVPSVTSLTQDLSTGTAVITCNSGRDVVNITDHGTGGVDVSATGLSGTQTLDPLIHRVVVNTNGGDDFVGYDVTGTQTRSMEVDAVLGSGDDKFVANQHGFDVTNSADEVIRVTGGLGSDVITVRAGQDPANGGVDVAAGAALRLLLVGGGDALSNLVDGTNGINVEYQGRLGGDLGIRADGGVQADHLRGLVTLDAGSTGQVEGFNGGSASLNGRTGADVLDFRVRNHAGRLPHVAAKIDAGQDLDRNIVRHTSNVGVVSWSGHTVVDVVS